MRIPLCPTTPTNPKPSAIMLIPRALRLRFQPTSILLFLSFLSFSVTILQTRAAWSLTINISLPWISQAWLWWIAIPIYVILLIIQWCAVLVELCILAAQAGVIIWWIGWFVKLVS